MQIVIDGLSKTYRKGRRALDGVDLVLDRGMTGLLGPNGAGKTTLMRILAGVLRPTSGRVLVGGHDLASSSGRTAVKRMLGYLPQELAVYPDLTAAEFLDYIALLKGIDDRQARRGQVEQLLGLVGLAEVAKDRTRTFSGGMKRRLGIAQALLGDPRLIIVDEPTAGLDPQERMRFRALLGTLGGDRTVILSTHILDDVARACPQVAVLTSGRVVFSGLTEGLVGAASGRTFVVGSAAALGPRDVVVNATAVAEGTRCRIVSDSPPPGAEPVPPTLEDGYVALMLDGEQARRVAS